MDTYAIQACSPPTARRRVQGQGPACLPACNEPGASIAAVALSHGLNANLVRKWRVGRGIKRTGIQAPVAETVPAAAAVPAAAPMLAADARFLPIALGTPAQATHVNPANQGEAPRAALEPIHIELSRGALHLRVRWPTEPAPLRAAALVVDRGAIGHPLRLPGPMACSRGSRGREPARSQVAQCACSGPMQASASVRGGRRRSR